MPIEWTPLVSSASLAMGALLFVVGGVRFRRWAVDERPGIPRFPAVVETVILWLLYSSVVSMGIVVLRQTLRHVPI